MTVSAPATMALTMSPLYLMPPSAMTGMSFGAGDARAVVDGRHLRHARAGDDARGADRAGADAHFDRIRAGLDQRQRAFRGDHVAGDDRQVGPGGFDAPNGAQHAGGMTVGGIDHDHVQPASHEQFQARFQICAHAHRRAAQQAAAASRWRRWDSRASSEYP